MHTHASHPPKSRTHSRVTALSVSSRTSTPPSRASIRGLVTVAVTQQVPLERLRLLGRDRLRHRLRSARAYRRRQLSGVRGTTAFLRVENTLYQFVIDSVKSVTRFNLFRIVRTRLGHYPNSLLLSTACASMTARAVIFTKPRAVTEAVITCAGCAAPTSTGPTGNPSPRTLSRL